MPVLTYLVNRFDQPEEQYVHHHEIAEATGLDEAQVALSLRNLNRAGYLNGASVDQHSYPMVVTEVTERALRTVGAWPTPESFADQFVSGLAAAVEREPDPDKRGRLKQLLGAAGGTVKDLSVEVAAAVISRSIGA